MRPAAKSMRTVRRANHSRMGILDVALLSEVPDLEREATRAQKGARM